MKRIEIVRGALIRIDGKGNKNVGAFLAFCGERDVVCYDVGYTNADTHVGFYRLSDVAKIEAWARATGCELTVKE
jgi:hypothetical protein